MWILDANGSSDLIIKKRVYLWTRNNGFNDRHLILTLKSIRTLAVGQSAVQRDSGVTGFLGKLFRR
jgi:hypothetical protein